jgi:WD40 repeat protein
MDKTIRVWDLAAESFLGAQSERGTQSTDYWSLSTDKTSVTGIAFSSDGRLLAATTPFAQNPSVTVYDAATMQQLSAYSGKVWRLNFSPDGRLLAVPDDRGTIQVYDIYSGKQTKVLRKHTSEVDSIEFSPDGRYLASAGEDKMALLWDLSTGMPGTLAGNSAAVTAITFSPDSRLVATGTPGDQAVRLYETATRHLRWSRQTPFGYNCLRFSPDGKLLLSGEIGGPLSLWSVGDGALVSQLVGHSSFVYDAAFSPDGLRLVTVAEDGTIRLWDLPRRHEMFKLVNLTSSDEGTANLFESVTFSPDGLRLVTAGDQEIRFWDAALLAEPPWHASSAYYAARGANFARFGRWQAAIHDLTRARELLPSDDSPLAKRYGVLILDELAYAEAKLGTEENQKRYLAVAMADYAASLKLTPDDPQILAAHADLALSLGRMAEFANDEHQALVYAQDQSAAANWVAWANLAAWDYALAPNDAGGNLAQLIAMQRRAVELSPDSYPIRSTLACLICRGGPTMECFGNLKKSMEKNKSRNGLNEPNGTAFDWVFMALADARRGQFEEARWWLRQTTDHMARVSADPLYSDPKYDWSWSDELELEIVQREVQAALERPRDVRRLPNQALSH